MLLYNAYTYNRPYKSTSYGIYTLSVMQIDTLRISGASELGPLEEKYATLGAGDLPMTVLLASICTTGFLCSIVV